MSHGELRTIELLLLGSCNVCETFVQPGLSTTCWCCSPHAVTAAEKKRMVRTVFAVRTRSRIQGALLLPQHWPVHKVTWRSAKCMARFAHPPLEVPVVIPHEAPGEGTAEASPTAPCTPTTATTLLVDDHEEAKREPLGARAGNDPLHSRRAPRQAHGGVIPHLVTHAAGEFALPLRTRGGHNKLGKALWPIWLRAHGRTAGTWHGTWHGQ